ncbi:efflux RND transporter permease subunit [Lacimicrobium sp. SS2-24]|uniref:efflux RND transporter permease subunit n=1 Tax=Lacimicrobium sp. SS2-24 TaxID=2005569 RepID=UPI000B4B2C85|nr:efflux RND transporter permease subunit [Lacimicrobium sp. SS2-24]
MSIVDIAVKRPVTVCMFTFAILLFGMVSLSRLALNLLPELSYPTLTIRADYPGAAPGEVEQLVSKPVEETIGVVKGVRQVKSMSKAGQSDVILEFEWGTDMDMASLDVREKLDVLQLPLDVKKPLLMRFNPDMDPILRLGLTADTITSGDLQAHKRLRVFAEEQIKRKLESVNGVASVKVGGGLENEIQVLVNQQKASQLNISMDEIIQRLKAENINSSGGRVQEGSREYLVRTLNQFSNLDEMRNLFVATREGRHIRLSDLAEIRDSHKERDAITRFNGLEGVEIAIYKEGDANTVQVANNVRKRLSQITEELPGDYALSTVYDQSRFIASAIEQVKSAGVVGGLLAMVVLYLFLKNLWPTLIISLSIPVSIIATFNLMYANDISLNIMSLGGIALAIGLLVDNSIVVLENIDRHKRSGNDVTQAAATGTKEVSSAIVASTLTTMAVFFPLVFVEGIAGQLFSDQALTVTFALGVSLVVALTLIPMLASRQKRERATETTSLDLNTPATDNKKKGRLGKIGAVLLWPFAKLVWLISKTIYALSFALSTLVLGIKALLGKLFGTLLKPVLWVFESAFNAIETGYLALLRKALHQRLLVLFSILGLSAASLFLLPKLGMELIPSMAQGEFHVEVTLPTGASLQQTDRVVADLTRFTEELDHVARTYSLTGTGSLMNASSTQGGDYWGKVNVVMSPDSGPQDELNVQEKMRTYLQSQAGVDAKFGNPQLFSFTTPLEIEISGYQLDALSEQADRLVALMQKEPRFVDVKSSLEAGHPELKIYFNHGRLAQLGLTAAEVAKLVSAKVGGEIASRYSIDDRKVDILVRSQTDQRDSIADIGTMIVNPGQSPAIVLDAVADIQMSVGPSEITRVGQERVAVISANLAYGDLGEAALLAKQLVNELNLPLNMQARVAGQNEEMQVSFDSLKLALLLAVFMVYLVMASQFESLLHPFLILFTVPLACAGSIYGLYLSGTHISVVVFIGLIMLAGIVVNNAIVLVDRINQLRAGGEEKDQAIFDAASSRLRPILMTTLTTTLGLLPMALGIGEGAEIRTPMAVTVIWGLVFATLLTLLLIPVLYSLFDRKTFQSAPANMELRHETA